MIEGITDRMRKPLLLALTALLIACATPLHGDLEQQRKKWREANITHYRFELNLVCFCVFRSRMPLQIEVLNGQVVAIMDNAGRAVTAEDANYDYFSRYATFDRLLSEIQSDLSGKADKVVAAYHPDYGFPTRITVDRITGAADDELSLTVSAFEQLP
jgi:hypothetical protein